MAKESSMFGGVSAARRAPGGEGSGSQARSA
jgi:hypothetical protein